jgi:hypothetical protein
MTLEMARFLRADNCWIKTLTTLAGVQCNVSAGNLVVIFGGRVNLTTLGLDGDVNQPATVVLRSGNTTFLTPPPISFGRGSIEESRCFRAGLASGLLP